MIHDRRTAAQVVERLIGEAEDSLRRAPAWCETARTAVGAAAQPGEDRG
jgi:hypothetical protein